MLASRINCKISRFIEFEIEIEIKIIENYNKFIFAEFLLLNFVDFRGPFVLF